MAVSTQIEQQPPPLATVWRWDMVDSAACFIDPTVAEKNLWVKKKKDKMRVRSGVLPE